MRTVILSDIHGNLAALELALAEIGRLRPDAVVCLGDVAAAGPSPNGVIDRLAAMPWTFIMGNTDEWLLEPTDEHPADEDARRVEEIERWGAARLTPESRAFLRTFLPTAIVETAPSSRMLCYHGAPESTMTEIAPTTSEDDLDRLLPRGFTLHAGGHTHIQMFRRHRESIVLNPGSLGLPMQTAGDGAARRPAWAEFATVDGDEGAALRVELRRLPMPLETVFAEARESGMPHAQWWMDAWAP